MKYALRTVISASDRLIMRVGRADASIAVDARAYRREVEYIMKGRVGPYVKTCSRER